MKRVPQILARLYPVSWRRRYGAEFDALLEESRPGVRGAGNVLWGAMAMQARTWNAGRLLVLMGIAGVAIALGIGMTMTKEYASSSVVKITSPAPEDGARLLAMQNDILSRTSLTKLVQTLGLYESDRAKHPIDDVLQKMGRDIAIRTGLPPVSAFQIEFKYSDPVLAKRVTDSLTEQFITANLRSGAGMTMQVLDVARVPDHPFSPSLGNVAFMGLLGGVGLGGVLVVLRRRFAKAA